MVIVTLIMTLIVLMVSTVNILNAQVWQLIIL